MHMYLCLAGRVARSASCPPPEFGVTYALMRYMRPHAVDLWLAREARQTLNYDDDDDDDDDDD